jgi:hypothetical protein
MPGECPSHCFPWTCIRPGLPTTDHQLPSISRFAHVWDSWAGIPSHPTLVVEVPRAEERYCATEEVWSGSTCALLVVAAIPGTKRRSLREASGPSPQHPAQAQGQIPCTEQQPPSRALCSRGLALKLRINMLPAGAWRVTGDCYGLDLKCPPKAYTKDLVPKWHYWTLLEGGGTFTRVSLVGQLLRALRACPWRNLILSFSLPPSFPLSLSLCFPVHEVSSFALPQCSVPTLVQNKWDQMTVDQDLWNYEPG